MPLFSRSGFRAGKKPVKRKSFSLGNVSSLDESTYSINELKLDTAGPLSMRLGGNELNFEKGQWTIGELYSFPTNTTVLYTGSKEGSQSTVLPSREYLQLQKENKTVQEENNLLKYKVELLLDMLALSNADNFALKEELETARKTKKKTKRK